MFFFPLFIREIKAVVEDSGSIFSGVIKRSVGFFRNHRLFIFQMNGRCLGFNGRHKLGPVSAAFPPAITWYVAARQVVVLSRMYRTTEPGIKVSQGLKLASNKRCVYAGVLSLLDQYYL